MLYFGWEVESILPVQLLRFQLHGCPCGHLSLDLVASPWTIQCISPSRTSPPFITFWGTQLPLPPTPLPPLKKTFLCSEISSKSKVSSHHIEWPFGDSQAPDLLHYPLPAPPPRHAPLGSPRHLFPGLLGLFSVNIIIILSIFEAN